MKFLISYHLSGSYYFVSNPNSTAVLRELEIADTPHRLRWTWSCRKWRTAQGGVWKYFDWSFVYLIIKIIRSKNKYYQIKRSIDETDGCKDAYFSHTALQQAWSMCFWLELVLTLQDEIKIGRENMLRVLLSIYIYYPCKDKETHVYLTSREL